MEIPNCTFIRLCNINRRFEFSWVEKANMIEYIVTKHGRAT